MPRLSEALLLLLAGSGLLACGANADAGTDRRPRGLQGQALEGAICAADTDCRNWACALESADGPARKVCCSVDYVYSSTLAANVCDYQPAGAACPGDLDSLCASGACVNGTCLGEQVPSGGKCDSHTDCVAYSCGMPAASVQGLIAGKVCCPTGSHVEFEEPLGSVCTGQPDGEYCGGYVSDRDEMCASGSCDVGWCSGYPSFEEFSVTPPTRFLTAVEFALYQLSEAGEDFSVIAEYASSLNMTVEELARRSNEVWDHASRFELARAVQNDMYYEFTFPFVICNEEEGLSGYQRKEKLRAAIREAMAGTDRAGAADDFSIMPVANEKDIMCGITMLYGTVAQKIACNGCVLQPLFQSMKMMPETFAKAQELMDLTIQDVESESDESQLQDSSGKELQDLPSIELQMCPGFVSKEDFAYLEGLGVDKDGTIDTTELNAYLLNQTTGWGTDIAMAEVSRNIYWANPLSQEVVPDESGRAVAWWLALNYTLSSNVCDEMFSERLIWKARLGESEKDFSFQRVYWNNTVASVSDAGCILGLIALLSVERTVCTMEFTPENKADEAGNAAWMTQSGIKDEKPWHDVGLDGTGQIVSVSDTGIDLDNCYFWDFFGFATEVLDKTRRKVVQYIPFANNGDDEWGHGTHVAGIVAGKRATDGIDESAGAADGVAPGAKIAFADIGLEGGNLIPPSTTELLGTGRPEAKIHSASWGATTNYYNSQAKAFDDYMYKNPDLLVVVAAGNSGRKGLNTVGAPAVAKNVLTVGASHSFGSDLEMGQLGPSHIADFSSKGPTADGRRKPDVVAPGKHILSAGARPNKEGECDSPVIPKADGGRMDGLLYQAGTSMATPVTSGTAALIRQYFEEGWYVTGEKYSGPAISLSAALLKAVLMNGAQADMKGVDNGPNGVTPSAPYDHAQGFGRIDLTKSVYIEGKTDVQIKFWDYEVIADGDTAEYQLTIDKSNGCTFDKLSATLVWVEPGSGMGCTKCLLNDLDLHITKNGDTSLKYYPNGRSRPDDMNNAERVLVGATDGDTFTLHVTASNLFDASQQYALVATGCFGGVPNTLNTTANVFSADETGPSSPGPKFGENKMAVFVSCSVVAQLLLYLWHH